MILLSIFPVRRRLPVSSRASCASRSSAGTTISPAISSSPAPPPAMGSSPLPPCGLSAPSTPSAPHAGFPCYIGAMVTRSSARWRSSPSSPPAPFTAGAASSISRKSSPAFFAAFSCGPFSSSILSRSLAASPPRVSGLPAPPSARPAAACSYGACSSTA